MQKHEILAIIIYLLLPFTGLLIFLWLRRKMRKEKIPIPPTLAFFIVFFNYGGLLVVLLTNFFLQWSGLASLGTFYLIFIAPILMATIAFYYYRDRRLSIYHKSAFMSGALYFIIFPLTLAIIFFISS
jgi:hypothetical protein